MNSYHQLTVFHRRTMGQLLNQGLSRRKIAGILGVHPSTVSREFRRNRSGFGYCCYLANDSARDRRYRANHRRCRLTPEVKSLISSKLAEKLSPEQIASLFPSLFGHHFSAQSIYRYIRSYDGQRAGLKRLLRRKGRRYITSSARRAIVRNRPSIDSRPPQFSDRSTFGHCEADLMEGPRHHKNALLVLVERKSRFVLIRHLPNRTAASVSSAIIHALRPFNSLSITFDNGTEFSAYKSIAAATGAAPFFCHPYHAWEKGTVENTIGLLREYNPKGSQLTNQPNLLAATQNQLNKRPRKILAFSSPLSLLSSIRKST